MDKTVRKYHLSLWRFFKRCPDPDCRWRFCLAYAYNIPSDSKLYVFHRMFSEGER